MTEPAFALTARRIVEVSAGLRRGETVCIVTDTNLLNIASAIAEACQAVGTDPVTCVMIPRKMHGNDPPEVIAAAMRAADVAISPTTYALTHTTARLEATRAGTRIVVLREITEDTFVNGAIMADYLEIDQLSRQLAKDISQGKRVHVRTNAGTDIELDIEDRKAFWLGGLAREPGSLTSLPSGEAAIAPVEGTAQGTIVVDHAIDGIGIVDRPVTIIVEQGRAVSIEGGEAAARLRRILSESDDNSTNVAEVAIGTNPLSRMRGNIAEDKIMRGVVHIALGDNHTIGGSVVSETHLDCVTLKPTVWIDDRVIVSDGNLDLRI